MADVAAGEIEPALHGKVRLCLDLLRDDFSEDELLSEVFRSDDDTVFTRRAAGTEQQRQNTDYERRHRRRIHFVHEEAKRANLCGDYRNKISSQFPVLGSQWALKRFSSEPRLTSANNARIAAGIAPARMT